MAYELRYELEFLNELEDTVLLEIFEDRTGDPIETVELNGSVQPIVQRGIDNDRDIFTPIRGQEVVAEIVSSTLGIIDFMADNDLTWRGILKVNGQTVFVGYLVQEDSQEEFVSYSHILRLRFTDGLGLLKGVPLSDTAGLPWHSTPTFYDIIRACLLKTGSTLPIVISNKLFPSDTTDLDDQAAMNISKVYTRSFMKDQREFLDCYQVLSSILTAWGCTLYQYRGQWVVDRWGDRLEQATARWTYDVSSNATYDGTGYDSAAIGETEDIKEVDTPLLLSIGRAAREARVTYRFDQWYELIRNLDLDEGARVALISDSTQSSYDLDYWTLVSRVAYSRRELDTLGNEKDRYLFINGAANNLDRDKYVRSGTFPAVKGDKINFQFSACSKNDLPGTAAIVYLKCGSYYLDDDGTWTTSAVFLRLDFAAAEDSTQWKTYTVESEEIRADGDVEIRLLLMQGCNTGNETRYKDIAIDYINVIGGRQARGDYNRYPNPVTKRNPIDQAVTISDSLRKTFRGAILKSSGALETAWQRGSNAEEYRFSQLNALAYYQASYRSKLIFEGTFRGTHYPSGPSSYPIGFWPGYTIADTAGKVYMLTTLDEVDWRTGIWRGTMVEVHDTTLDVDIETPPENFDYNFIFE